MSSRTEMDSLGSRSGSVRMRFLYWGAQTFSGRSRNLPISGVLPMPARFIRALAIIKKAWARINLEQGLLPEKSAAAIMQAADEIASGKLTGQFPVDVFQTGSATSTNMNANEVISNRAIEILGGERGSRKPVHPNDDVNMSQSSNDIIPTALHVAALDALVHDLIPALKHLHKSLAQRAKDFDDILKIGRTHMMDAVPMRLGQEFGGYASQVEHAIGRAEGDGMKTLWPCELALGGNCGLGTASEANPKLPPMVIAKLLAKELKLPFKQAPNPSARLAARDAAVETSGVLKTIACSLNKIANDLRLLSSGPRCGIGEILLPDLQPGSSIMPGKVNPVMPEMLTMVAAQVIGCDAAIAAGGMQGHFELNTFKPLIAHNLLFAMQILANGCRTFADKCVDGISANRKRCEEYIETSLMLATALRPKIGYDAAAALAKEAGKSGKTVRQLATEKNLMPQAELDRLLNVRSMTE